MSKGLSAAFVVMLALPLRAGEVAPATALPDSVPAGIGYHGRLEQNGLPVTGTKPMRFRIYDVLSGGTPLWSGPEQEVGFERGAFGAVIPVSTSALAGGGARYLEVEVEGVPLSPREAFSAQPYALVAKTVEGSLDLSGGGLAVSSGAAGVTALFVSSATGFVGVGTSDPSYRLDVSGDVRSTGAVAAAALAAGAAAVLGPSFSAGGDSLWAGAGLLGVGTSAPGARLAVSGNLSLSGTVFSSGTGASFFAGALGVGTNSPQSRLHVLDGDVRLSTTDASTRGIYFTDGSFRAAAAPDPLPGSITHPVDALVHADSDGNASGAVRLGGGGGESLRVANDGKVGVGTTAPATLLDVEGAARFGGAGFKSVFTVGGQFELASGASWLSPGSLTLSTAASAALTGVPALFLDGSGRAGVGVSAPSAALHAGGDVRAEGSYRVAGGLTALRAASAGLVEIGEAGTAVQVMAGSLYPRLYVSAAGRVGVGTSEPAALFTVRYGSVAATADGRVGVGTLSPGARLHVSSGAVVVGGSSFLLLDETTFTVRAGLVGVGTTGPSTLFQVAGGTLVAVSSGMVGIGTTEPVLPLDVRGELQIGIGAVKSTFTNSGSLLSAADVSAATFNGLILFTNPMSETLELEAALPAPSLNTATQPGLEASTSVFIMAGSLGLGTSAPAEKLHYSSGTLLIDGLGAGVAIGRRLSDFVVTGSSVGVGAARPGARLHVSSGAVLIDGADPGLVIGLPDFVVKASSVGVGTALPGEKLHVSSGSLRIDGSPAEFLRVGVSTLVVVSGRVAVGTASAVTALEVNGAARFGAGASQSTFTVLGDLRLRRDGGVSSDGTLTISTAASAALTGTPALFIDRSARVGVGTGAPRAALAVGSPLPLPGMSSAAAVNAGTLGTAAGSQLLMASLGYVTDPGSDATALGLRALRAAAGAGADTVAFGVGMDVDGVPSFAGGAFWLHANGNVGIGTSVPTSLLTVRDGDVRIGGAGRGIYFTDGSFQATASGSAQWGTNGSDIYSLNPGNVGIGTSLPEAQLTIGASALRLHYDSSIAAVPPAVSARVDLGPAGLVGKADFSGKSCAANSSFLYYDGGVGGWRYTTANRAGYAWGGCADGTWTMFSAPPTGAAAGLVIPDERLKVTAAGNVGLGSSAPSSRLVVEDAGGALVRLRRDAGNQWFIAALPSSDRLAVRAISNTDLAEKLTLMMDGKIGLGNTAPAYSVDVAGDVNASGVLREGGDRLIPTGAVTFFNLGACPAGWSELDGTGGKPNARGRYVVGLPSGGTLNATVGTALSNGENRSHGIHNHSITDPGHSHSYLRVGGPGGLDCCSSAGFNTGTTGNSFTGITATEDTVGTVSNTNAPYVQYLLCQKD